MKELIKKIIPKNVLFWWYWTNYNRDLLKEMIEERLNVSLIRNEDYYSPLPIVKDLSLNKSRWLKPSKLYGIDINLDEMLSFYLGLSDKYLFEYSSIKPYDDIQELGFGVGFTRVDARTLFYMLRHIKPNKYLEIGSGVSTYYCSLVSEINEQENNTPIQIHCIEPYPKENLTTIKNISLTKDFVQNVPLEKFSELKSGDVLFIDSSHAAKIDSDVYYEILDILPNLQKGVYVHIHDIPFPYNFPYPAELYVLGKKWPQFWNEPAFVQAFLAFNDSFKVILSVPYLLHFSASEVLKTIPEYNNEISYSNAIGSLWLQKIK